MRRLGPFAVARKQYLLDDIPVVGTVLIWVTFPILTFGIDGQGNQEYRSPRNNHMPIWHVSISCAQIKARARRPGSLELTYLINKADAWDRAERYNRGDSSALDECSSV